MGLDRLGFLTVGTLVPKEGGETLSLSTLIAISPWSRKPQLLAGSQWSLHYSISHATLVQQGTHSRW